MPELIAEFKKHHPRPNFDVVYGASGSLRNQVADGAPVDAVLFASGDPVDALVAAGHVTAVSRHVAARNSLVLIGPRGGKRYSFATIDTMPSDERLAIGDPGAVPAGRYAREALENLQKWSSLEGSRLVYGGDVGAVVMYVRRGEVAAGIVYSTELTGNDDVVVLDRAEGDWVPNPVVVVGVVASAKQPRTAQKFLDFVRARRGQQVLATYGFLPP